MKFFTVAIAAAGTLGLVSARPAAVVVDTEIYGGYPINPGCNNECGEPHFHGDYSPPAPPPPFGPGFLEDYFDNGPRCGVRGRTYTTGYVPKLRPRTYENEVDFEIQSCGAPLKFLAAPEATTTAAIHYYGKDFFTRGAMNGQLSEQPVKSKAYVAVAPQPCGCGC